MVTIVIKADDTFDMKQVEDKEEGKAKKAYIIGPDACPDDMISGGNVGALAGCGKQLTEITQYQIRLW
jgi:hypothetical protein